MKLALEKIGYDDLRREQAEARAEGKLYGVGLASFTEVVGAGPHKDFDILGLKMSDGAELRIHPTVKGAATAMVSRKVREKARKLAAHLLEVSEDDVEFEKGKFFVKGAPDKVKTIQDVAFAAYTNFPEGMEAGLEGVTYYDPPNMTCPF